MSSTSTNKQPMLVDRPGTLSTLVTVASGQAFSTSLLPTAVGNATKVFDVDSSLTDTSISGAYIDEIWLAYSKRNSVFIDAQSALTGTYTQSATAVVITVATHNLQVGQKIYVDYTSGTGVDEIVTVTALTSTTITYVSASSLSTSGNVSVYTNQFYPLFTVSVPSTFDNQNYSLTLNSILPLINHPVVQSGNNFTSTNSTVSPKSRGLMLQRGQALYVATGGTTALTNGFYCNIQAGYY